MIYGVLRGRPDRWVREEGDATPHLQIRILDDSGVAWPHRRSSRSRTLGSEVAFWLVDPLTAHLVPPRPTTGARRRSGSPPPSRGSPAGCSATSAGSTSPACSAGSRGSGRHPALVETQAWIAGGTASLFDGLAVDPRTGDEHDGIGFHLDRELRWLEDTVIGVLSLGAQRPGSCGLLPGHKADSDDLTGVIDLVAGQR